MMDIFTILVFFLLVNSNAQQLPSSKDIKLPLSVSTKTPQENLVIAITKQNIIVGGHKIAELDDVLSDPKSSIPALLTELQFQTSKYQVFKEDKNKPHSVTIMGDQDIPYKLLSKILTTCRQAKYTHIAFAAYQKKKG